MFGWLIVLAIGFLVWPRMYRASTDKRLNPVLSKCSACGAECRRRVPGRLLILDFVLWCVFCFTALNFTSRLSFGSSMLITLMFALVWSWASRRVYHAWFIWRHPTRCGGGGEPEPQPTH